MKFSVLVACVAILPATFIGCGGSVDNSAPPTASELEAEAEIIAAEEAAEDAGQE